MGEAVEGSCKKEGGALARPEEGQGKDGKGGRSLQQEERQGRKGQGRAEAAAAAAAADAATAAIVSPPPSSPLSVFPPPVLPVLPVLYLQQSLTKGIGDDLIRDFQAFHWSWLAEMKKVLRFGGLTTNLLLIGQDGCVTPSHYDKQENFFAQVR